METLFDELKRYVGFSQHDEQALRCLHPVVAPHFTRIADVFYQRILGHEQARTALASESQVGRLKVTLVAWMDRLLAGPWDEEYFALRCRIGRVHVRINLPQHYMFGAMNVVRLELDRVVDEHCAGRPDEAAQARAAVDRILDLELAIMLHTFREDLVSQQARHERLSTFGQLVGSIGHELRNPLGVIESSLYILRQRARSGPAPDERTLKHLDRIGEQLGVANSIISTLLDMIRDRPLAREQVALEALVADVLGSASLAPEVEVRVEGIDRLPLIAADPRQLRQVFANLVENAAHAVGRGGRIRIAGARMGDAVEIAVEDDGAGVSPTVVRRLFEPLVTTKAKGIGLGLALVKRIVDNHGGAVTYEPRAPSEGGGGGARFIVRLPIEAPPPAGSNDNLAPAPLQRRGS